MKVVVAEKPSVAKAIASVIGANKSSQGYIYGNGFYVTWCYGHLVELLMPGAYDEKYKNWNKDSLPIIPNKWLYGIKKETKEQFSIVKDLFQRNDVDCIVCATDAGREGELIFRNVYDMCKCKKPIQRLWISSMEDSAIREGFDNLQNGEKYNALYMAAKAREQADWLAGMNLSRLFTLIYGGGNKMSIGRVMTPTLAMICERDDKIEKFISEKYYVVHIKDNNKIDAISPKIDDKEKALEISKMLVGKEAIVNKIERKSNNTIAPLLYDLTSLQRDCNRILGFSANKTLDIAQELYEKKLTTYPRTDAKYLTNDMEPTLVKIFAYSKELLDYADKDITPVNKNRLLDSSKVSDHHAIIPTGSSSELDKLSEDSKKVYELICVRVITSMSEAYTYESVKFIINCENQQFTMTGQIVKNNGYKKYDTSYRKKYKLDKEKNSECILPDIREGHKFTVKSDVEEKNTKPMQRFTEDTLLDAMEKAGNKEMADEVERKGLGTSATRAGIIEKLISCGYVNRDKKKLISTDIGRYLISIVPDKVKSVELTCDWENMLLDVSLNKLNYDTFMRKSEDYIKQIVFENKTRKPVDRKVESICKCPVCGGAIVNGKFGPYCSSKCGISLKIMGKPLTDKQLIKFFVEKKEILMKDITSSKGGTYDAYFSYKDVEKYSFTGEKGNTITGYRILSNIRFPKK